MATKHRIQPTNTVIHPERLELALSAAAAIGSVAGPLQSMTAGLAIPEVDAAHQLAIRVEQLASVILSALNDQETPPDGDLAEAWCTYMGPELHRQMTREAEAG
jgi:hypothetical protein